jgi:hypothetical protein
MGHTEISSATVQSSHQDSEDGKPIVEPCPPSELVNSHSTQKPLRSATIATTFADAEICPRQLSCQFDLSIPRGPRVNYLVRSIFTERRTGVIDVKHPPHLESGFRCDSFSVDVDGKKVDAPVVRTEQRIAIRKDRVGATRRDRNLHSDRAKLEATRAPLVRDETRLLNQ